MQTPNNSSALAVNTRENHLSNHRMQDIGALALIAALVLLFFWRIITPRIQDRAVFPPGDFTDQFWAFRMYEAREFAQGRLPLWSENFNSGHPFLADIQSAVYYPPSLMWTLAVVATRGDNFTLLDLEIEAIFHFILAGIFTYLFVRELLASRVAALVGALTFAFGGYLTSYPPQQLAILETATWLPLILLLMHRGLYRGGAYYLGAGLVLGITALAGHPQTFLFVVYASAIYFFWESRHHSHRFTHYLLRFAVLLLIAAGISAAQWIPSVEYQTVSTRAAISWPEAASGFPTLDPLQMILPGFINAFSSPLYVGVIPLWLALFALLVNRSREKQFWAWLALGSLVVSFGFYVFAYALFYLIVPGFAMFRGQERLAFIVSFSLAMLASYGARDLLGTELEAKRARRAWALLPAGITISLVMMLMLYISGTLRQSGHIAFLGDRAGLMALLFLLASIVVGLRLVPHPSLPLYKRDDKVGRIGAFALALILFDLFSINSAAYNADPAPRYPSSPIIDAIRQDSDIFRVADEGKMPGHFGIAYQLNEIGGISPLRIASYDFLKDNLAEEKLWPLLNVRYVITGRPGFSDAQVVTQDGETRLLRLENTLPRAWFVSYAIQNANDSQVVDAISSDGFDPGYIAYLADVPRAALPTAAIQPAPRRGAQAGNFQLITPEHSRVSLNAPADGWLVVSENYYYPGWHAQAGGLETPILRANIALSAVPVHAGSEQVEFIFDPWSVKVGIAISIITSILVLGVFIRYRRLR
jgi:membrane protein YfhO